VLIAPASLIARALDETAYRAERIVEPGKADRPATGAHDYDLAILGSGGGAFAAAIAARRRDLRVVMIERDTVGGTCVNIGCIPS
jgi:mercuric reductase